MIPTKIKTLALALAFRLIRAKLPYGRSLKTFDLEVNLDVLMGVFMWSLIESQNRNRKYTMLYVAFWIYNPVTVGMSTRGSNDNIIALLVFASLYFLLKK